MIALLIRCEATPALGTGHALRCLALAQEWIRREGRVVFAMVEPEPALVARIRAAGATVELLRATPGSPADAMATAAMAQRLDARWVVVDGPMFGFPWDAAWPGESRLLRIDDNGLDRSFRADLLLNQNLGAAVGDYPAKAGPGRLLLGTEYVLLRPEFLRVTEERPAHGGRVVVTLGGTDPACATERMLAALQHPAVQGIAADFVIGATNPRRETLVRAIGLLSPRLQAVVAPTDLPQRFASAQLAVTAGGTTLYELALLRAPMLVLCTADNQRRTCERFEAAEAARYAGWHAEVTPLKLAALLAELTQDEPQRAALSERAGLLVDGRGAARVVDAMLGGGT